MHPAGGNDLRFRTAEFKNDISRAIAGILGRPLSDLEFEYVCNSCDELTPLSVNSNPRDVFTALINHLTTQIRLGKCGSPDLPIDIHEMNKERMGAMSIGDRADKTLSRITANPTTNHVNIASFLGLESIMGLQSLINPALVRRYTSILLDSRYRLEEGTTYYKWTLSMDERTSPGNTNTIAPLARITSIRVFPIRIPYNVSSDNTENYNRITMSIDELGAQGVIAHENRKYHYMFEPTINDRWIDLNPYLFNEGICRFREPINNLSSITITFATPLRHITFDTDRMYATVFDYDTLTTTFETAEAHNLETGDLVYISEFNTKNNNRDALVVSQINSESGHNIKYLTDTTFSIEVPSDTIDVVGVGTVSATTGSPSIVGAGTNFLSFFMRDDAIFIAGVEYRVLQVSSNTALTLTANYTGATAALLAYERNNIDPATYPRLYFGSKRIFVHMELEYLGDDTVH